LEGAGAAAVVVEVAAGGTVGVAESLLPLTASSESSVIGWGSVCVLTGALVAAFLVEIFLVTVLAGAAKVETDEIKSSNGSIFIYS